MDYFALFCNKYCYINYIFRKNGGWSLVLRSLFFKTYFLDGVYGSLDLDNLTWTLLVICINVKVFELTILLSSAMNMVTQIIYLGRMEVGDWYYGVCFLKNIFLLGFTAVWT